MRLHLHSTNTRKHTRESSPNTVQREFVRYVTGLKVREYKDLDQNIPKRTAAKKYAAAALSRRSVRPLPQSRADSFPFIHSLYPFPLTIPLCESLGQPH